MWKNVVIGSLAVYGVCMGIYCCANATESKEAKEIRKNGEAVRAMVNDMQQDYEAAVKRHNAKCNMIKALNVKSSN